MKSHLIGSNLLRLVRAALFALLIAMTAMAGAASAAVPGLQLRSATSFSDSSATKSQVARCPSGTKLINASGSITINGSNTGAGEVVLTNITPLADLSGVSVSAAEVASQQTTLAWSVTAHAICANATAVQGLELVRAETPGIINSTSPKKATAICPSGKTLLGSGGGSSSGVFNGRAGVAIEDITPNGTLTSVTVQAAETFSGSSDSWRARAFAICASSAVGAQVATATSTASPFTPKSALARCPSGMKVIGSGADIGVPLAPGRVFIDEIRPLSDLSGVLVVATEAELGTTNNWNVTARAICATP
jgi:hypothetical protein